MSSRPTSKIIGPVRVLFLSAVVMLLCSCIATGPAYQAAPPPKDTEALVYVYRAGGLAFGGLPASIVIDGNDIGDLGNNGYTWVHVVAGKHVLKQEWPLNFSFPHTNTLFVEWKAGATYYYRLDTAIGPSSYSSTSVVWRLAEMNPDYAVIELRTFRYEAAKTAELH